MSKIIEFGEFSVHQELQETIDGEIITKNLIKRNGKTLLYLHNLEDCKDVANVLSVLVPQK